MPLVWLRRMPWWRPIGLMLPGLLRRACSGRLQGSAAAAACTRRLRVRGLATETREATPIPPPPPPERNYVYPIVLLTFLAGTVFVMVTPDDDAIDTKIMDAVRSSIPQPVVHDDDSSQQPPAASQPK